MRVSFMVKVSVRVIQVAILSCNCEATQPRRSPYMYFVLLEGEVVHLSARSFGYSCNACETIAEHCLEPSRSFRMTAT